MSLIHFFVNIGPRLASCIKSTVSPLSYVHNVVNSIVILPVTEFELRQIISSLKCSAAGWDNFPPFLGKQCVDEYIYPLSTNRSVNECFLTN